MLTWLGAEWHKIIMALTGAMVFVVHGELFFEKISKMLGLKTYIERSLIERRHDTMPNILEIFTLIAQIQKEAPVLLPDALKIMSDINQSMTDFQRLINDFQQATGKTPIAPTSPQVAA